MADAIDPGTRLELYKLVLTRYKDLVSDKETKSVSEIRQRVSPYDDFIRKMRQNIIADLAVYDPKIHFLQAAQKAMSYIRRIRTCEFAFTFWMRFDEMDRLNIGTAMDKALFLTALLRSLEAEDVRVIVTRKGRPLVRFSSSGSDYLFVPESGSIIVGEDCAKMLSEDPPAYSFSDLLYENYEES
ncbi:MAG: hypothetical protein U0R44_00025 [Candidatus Micrarchaeia archaeon]